MSEKKIKDLRINKGLTKQQLIESTAITEDELSFVTDDSVVDVPAPTEAGKVLTSTVDGVKWAEGGGGGGDYLPLSGGAMTGPFIAPKHTDYTFDSTTVLQLRADTNSVTGTPVDIQVSPTGNSVKFVAGITTTRGINPDTDGTLTLGSSYLLWKNIFVKKINNGADIDVPTTGGTMVVATPPTAAGMVLISTESGSEWSDVIGNINTLLDAINGEVA